MPVLRPFKAGLLAAIFGAGFALSSQAAEVTPRVCLSKAEAQAAVAARQAVPLAQAIKSLREQGKWAEVVRARLCRRGDGLVYVLTLLARNGKVTLATIDAANGELINGR